MDKKCKIYPDNCRGYKTLIPSHRWEGLGINRYFSYRDMPYGANRRKSILQWLDHIQHDSHNYITINKKYCIILKHDRDLQRLLKEGKVKMFKIRERRNHTISVIGLLDWRENNNAPI